MSNTHSATPVYHFTARANVGFKPFTHRLDALLFWNSLRKRFPRGVVACVLMDNHVHLLIESARPSSVRKNLGIALAGFSRRYNARYGHRLSFERCKSTSPIDSASTLRQVIRYIHLNPCKAGMIRNPWLWEFSTLREWEGASLQSWVFSSSPSSPLAHSGSRKILGKTIDWYQSHLQSDAERISDQVETAQPLAFTALETLADADLIPVLRQLLHAEDSAFTKRGPARNTYIRVRRARGLPFQDSLLRLAQETGVNRKQIRALHSQTTQKKLRRVIERVALTAIASHWDVMPDRRNVHGKAFSADRGVERPT